MPRKKNSTTAEATDAALLPAATLAFEGEEAPISEHGDDTLPPPDVERPSAGRVYAADPCPTTTVNLCDYSGGPAMHLMRSHRFKQMQVRFDHGQPDERYLLMLKRAGWTDRSESEGVWTKQIDPGARWQSVDQMEKEFKAIANAIRKERGLAPVLERLALA
jgi:hypothetical protein